MTLLQNSAYIAIKHNFPDRLIQATVSLTYVRFIIPFFNSSVTRLKFDLSHSLCILKENYCENFNFLSMLPV